MMPTAQGLIAPFERTPALKADFLVHRFPFLGVIVFHLLIGKRMLREHHAYQPLVSGVDTECTQDTANGRRRRSSNCRENFFIFEGGHDEQDANGLDCVKL